MKETRNIPIVILAGGLGLRIRDHSDKIPKALVPVGELAIIEHVMKIYSHNGFDNFIICIGYLGDKIKRYFKNRKNWKNIIIIETGLETPTGGRIKKIERHITSENFIVTYCDGLADIDIRRMYLFHLNRNKLATLAAVHPMSQFGLIELKGDVVRSFKEKPMLSGYINGGFYVFNRAIFKYLKEDSTLEEEVMRKLVREKQLIAYKHTGFWACMDTYKDVSRLNTLWKTGVLPNVGVKIGKPRKPPWKVWND